MNKTSASQTPISQSVIDSLKQASSTATNFLENDPRAQEIADLSKEWAKEATKFIQRNPWAAVLGAAAIGYFLGSTRNRGSGSR